ncbi:testicular acid phosphatase homolog isoform X2 [Hermetia illucens]|uniref:testicular acid phosphatase homolog isoform X2 n=1 Tax=Hermetia illucens TaxID=343691 RepID=UPI0018CC2980|nr:testicular acid phosphatase homolog isoform X2 [Hermetia illucens]
MQFNMTGMLFGFLLVCCQKRASAKPTLKAVLMLTRHGDRAPNGVYPKDPYLSFRWPGGLGALSKKGERQMKMSGSLKAARYKSLLGSIDNSSVNANIFVLSSSMERCFKSARYFLDGFLTGKWNEDLINVLPHEQDEFLLVKGKSCSPYYKTLFSGCSFEDPDVKNFLKSNNIGSRFFKLLEEKTGLEMTSIGPVFLLDDILSVQRDNGFPLPKWAYSLYDQYIHPIARFAFDKMSSSDYMQIRSGVLLRDMIERLDAVTSDPSRQNIVLYSAHDLTISALMHHMEIIDQCDIKPEYGACFAIELYENPDIPDDYQLFYFKNYADQHPAEIKLPFSNKLCTFKEFKDLMNPKVTNDYEKTCSESRSSVVQ